LIKHLFYLGKGGVGKSTISSLNALENSNRGKQVLIVSLDPAHNLADIFKISLSDKPNKIKENLIGIEINLNAWIKKYLNQIELKLKNTYQYLSALNLEDHFNIIRYSPGIEEYALLLAYDFIIRKYEGKDIIIFDMPPTALTLKFFSLPGLSLLWLEKLMQLRNEIIEKRQILTKIKFGKKDIETDKILNSLSDQIKLYSKINASFHNQDQTQLNLVINADQLSLSESQLIISRLKELNLEVSHIILNKSGTLDKEIPDMFKKQSLSRYSQANYPLIGIENLDRYLNEAKIEPYKYHI